MDEVKNVAHLVTHKERAVTAALKQLMQGVKTGEVDEVAFFVHYRDSSWELIASDISRRREFAGSCLDFAIAALTNSKELTCKTT